MGVKRDKLLSESIGKIISIFYNDTFSSVSFKTGHLLEFDESVFKILEFGKEMPVLIPRTKCIRIELGGRETNVVAKTI